MTHLLHSSYDERMYLAYADDSGDSGYENSQTKFLVLACFIIHESEWQTTLDKLIGWRRKLRDEYSIPVRSELKAEHFIYGRGPLRDLGMSRHERLSLYGTCLDFVASSLPAKTFAIAIAKHRINNRSMDPRRIAWRYLLQRLDKFCESQSTQEHIMLFPDEGHGLVVRKTMREIRRFNQIRSSFGDTINIPAKSFIEDPVSKNSADSYFSQVADWMAYVAHRCEGVDPNTRVPGNYWRRLQQVLLEDVNRVAGGPPGIVVWPRA